KIVFSPRCSLPVPSSLSRARRRRPAILRVNRVRDGVAPVAFSHHRTCGSAYGGSLNMLEAVLSIEHRNQSHLVKYTFWICRAHVACSGVPPGTASVACRFPRARPVQSASLQPLVAGGRALPLPPK